MESKVLDTQKTKKKFKLTWRDVKDYILVLAGALLQAVGTWLFTLPGSLVSGGVFGLAQIIYYQFNIPVGLIALVFNIPLFVIGWKHLGGFRFAIRTVIAIVVSSVLIDLLTTLPATKGMHLTESALLNTLFGGVLVGVGLGLVYLGRGTSGGTDIIARILNKRFGTSVSTIYMVTDTISVFLAGILFDWEKALYGLILIYVSGVAVDMTLQGIDVVRQAMIVTENYEAVASAIVEELNRSSTIIPAKGGYTKEERNILFCVVMRSEVALLKEIVQRADPKAFMVVGHANEALGEGFNPLED
ncbi:MAG: YitT family protein [Chloroflexi bacterium]|nr:YitT family protein [Chloroflexota bacterium]